MGQLEGRVAVITGAGRGIGREHAILLASEGAKVVVNDMGSSTDGSGHDRTAAQDVVDEIRSSGGDAVANDDNVADWEGAQRLINTAIESFGDLHVLVNNAGILRDRLLANMTEAEWDAVVDVHLKGHFAPTRWAATYWREQHRTGGPVNASIVNTASAAGLCGNFGQANYAAAKAGIAAFTIVTAMELGEYGVRANCVAPVARTRLLLQTPGIGDVANAPDDPGQFDAWDPANVSPLVAYLATDRCPLTGGVFHVGGGEVGLFQNWTLVDNVRIDERWTVDRLASEFEPRLNDRPPLISAGTTIAALTSDFISHQ